MARHSDLAKILPFRPRSNKISKLVIFLLLCNLLQIGLLGYFIWKPH